MNKYGIYFLWAAILLGVSSLFVLAFYFTIMLLPVLLFIFLLGIVVNFISSVLRKKQKIPTRQSNIIDAEYEIIDDK